VDDNRKKALSAALGQIEKQFGKGAIMRMGDDTTRRDIEVISTGCLGLDIALGIGGLPRGRVCEIYGPESVLLTSLLWIRWQPSHPRPRLKVTWVTVTSVCTPA